jgi:hypothetical protein
VNAYAVSRLRPGDSVYFVDAEEWGRVLVIWSDRVRIYWDSDDTETELFFDDCEGLELVSASEPREQAKVVNQRMLQEAIVEAL